MTGAVTLGRVPGGLTTLALAGVMGLDAADQSTIGASAPELREALSVGSTQVGLIATSSTVVGVLLTVPFGILADRRPRLAALRVAIAVWVLAALAVGAAPGYGVLLACHCALGVVTGASAPMIASLVGDLVPHTSRGRVYSVLLLGELAGSAIGTGVLGEVAAALGFRWAFWLLAAFGVGALLAVARATEPERRAPRRARRGEPEGQAQVSLREAIGILLRIRTNVVLVVASALGYYYFTGVQTFAVSLWVDDYGVSRGLAPVYVLLVGLALAVGVVVGGPFGDRLLLRGHQTGRVVAVLVAFGGCLVFLVPALSTTRLAVTVPLLLVAGVMLGMANPPLDATRIDIVPPRLLGRAEAIRNALRDGADATAPVLFGVLGAHVGLRGTFLVMTAALALAGLLGLAALRYYAADAVAAGNGAEATAADG